MRKKRESGRKSPALQGSETGKPRARVTLPQVKNLLVRIKRRASRARVDLSPELAAGLVGYLELLSLWNRKINLISFLSWDRAIDRLIVEPLVMVRHLTLARGSLLDIGSGGGSPAIPIKLAAPGFRVWMVESKTRKSAFLREAVRRLDLKDVNVETARFEQLLSYPGLHEAMDFVTIRALRVERRTLMSLQAFLRPGGCILWFRGAGGPTVPSNLTPPLVWQGTYPLVDVLQSRLVVVRKASVSRY